MFSFSSFYQPWCCFIFIYCAVSIILCNYMHIYFKGLTRYSLPLGVILVFFTIFWWSLYHTYCVSTTAYTLCCVLAFVLQPVISPQYLHESNDATVIYSGCRRVEIQICSIHCESTEMFVQMEKAITEHSYRCGLHAEEKDK